MTPPVSLINGDEETDDCGYIGKPSASVIVTLRLDTISSASYRNGLWLLGV